LCNTDVQIAERLHGDDSVLQKHTERMIEMKPCLGIDVVEATCLPGAGASIPKVNFSRTVSMTLKRRDPKEDHPASNS
jgi:hypothetical protein